MAIKNLTIALPEELLIRSRRYAEAHGTTINNLIRSQLENIAQPVAGHRSDRLFAIADDAKARTPRKWHREELQIVNPFRVS